MILKNVGVAPSPAELILGNELVYLRIVWDYLGLIWVFSDVLGIHFWPGKYLFKSSALTLRAPINM